MKESFQIWLRAALVLLLAFAGLLSSWLVPAARAYVLFPSATKGSTIIYDDQGNVANDSSRRSPFGSPATRQGLYGNAQGDSRSIRHPPSAWRV